MKEMRKLFREGVFKRDGFKCVFCEEKRNLDAHHIINRKKIIFDGYTIFNGITLCPKHHWDAEDGILSEDFLFAKINSSKEKAVKDLLNK
jgi:predicted restriction endonuclease